MISGLFSLPLLPAIELDERLPRAASDGAQRHLEHFLAGPENALVRSLAAAVIAESPPYNPIVLCGPSGVGKTSLAHALAARRREHRKLKGVLATSGADLARALASAIETDSVADLRTRHHRCDLLLIDDLHRLSNKPAAQQFLLAALAAVLRRGALVIATLSDLPQATDGLLPALASRLAGGLVARLSPPGQLARRELVRETAERLDVSLADDAMEQLAGHDERVGCTTAPKLRHAVLQLAADAKGRAQPIRSSHVARLLAAEAPPTKAIVRQVLAAVARHAGLTVSDLKGKSRQQAVADARSLAMHLVRRVTRASYAEIGRHVGGRDHTTVLHACKRMEGRIATSDEHRRLADDLAARVVAGATSG